MDKRWQTERWDMHVNPCEPMGEDRVIAAIPPAPVLDYGCGFGRLAPRIEDYYGVDIARHRILKCRQSFPDKRFAAIETPDELLELRFGCVIADNVFIHIDDADIEVTLNVLCTISDYVIVAEHLGRHWRDGSAQRQNRDFDDYLLLFHERGFALEMRFDIMNPRYDENFSVMRWSRR